MDPTWIIIGVSVVIVLAILGILLFGYFSRTATQSGKLQAQIDAEKDKVEQANRGQRIEEEQDKIMATSKTFEDTAKDLEKGDF